MAVIKVLPTADTYVAEAAAATNYLTSPVLSWSRLALTRQLDLLRFTIPAEVNGTVTAATITFDIAVGTAAVACTIAPTIPNWVGDEVTWNEYATGLPWVGADVDAAGNYDSSLAVTDELPLGAGTWVTEDLSAIVKDAVDNRSRVMSIAIYPLVGDAAQVWTGSSQQGATAPYLTLTYLPAVGPSQVFNTRLSRPPNPVIWSQS
jgi:hypothetical protein